MNHSYRRFACINLMGLLISGLLFAWIARSGTLDFWLAQQFFDPAIHRFPWRDSSWLEWWGHSLLKSLTVLIWVLCIALALMSSWVKKLYPWRRALSLFVLMAGCAAFIVQTLKGASVHSCPWDLHVFGGQAQWFPLFGAASAGSGPGLCWPGGHASGGFALSAAYFVLRESRPRQARWMLATGLLFGMVMSLVQMARGAHFLSHNLWSLWLVWATCFAIDAVAHYCWRSR